MRSLRLCVVVLCFAIMGTICKADAIDVQNASFENFNPLTVACGSGCAYNHSPIPGWTTTGFSGSFQPSVAFFSAALPDGSIVGYTNGGTIFQDLGTTLSANTFYTLSVWVGDRLDGLNGVYSLALTAGGSSLCSFSGNSASIPAGTFAKESCSFSTGNIAPTGDLTVLLTSGGAQADFDSVSVATGAPVSTPEASSLSLLGLGLIFGSLTMAFVRR